MFAGWANIGFAALVDEWARELGQATFILLTGAAIFVVAKGIRAMVETATSTASFGPEGSPECRSTDGQPTDGRG